MAQPLSAISFCYFWVAFAIISFKLLDYSFFYIKSAIKIVVIVVICIKENTLKKYAHTITDSYTPIRSTITIILRSPRASVIKSGWYLAISIFSNIFAKLNVKTIKLSLGRQPIQLGNLVAKIMKGKKQTNNRGVHACSCIMGNHRVQRNYTLNLECKEVSYQFFENLNFYIHFCNFDIVELQKMYENIYVF